MRRFMGAGFLKLLIFTADVFLCVFLISCSGNSIVQKEAGVPRSQITLGPGDEIEVKFYNVPELDETQFVRQDGCISLHLVGDVKVEGLTIPQVRDTLITLFTPVLQNPDIVVIARSMFSNMIHVGGEVNTPGYISMPGRLTALEAIMQAGGFNTATASAGNVVIIRFKDGKRYGGKLNLSGALKGKEVQPFFLEPHDIVYVPRTRIVSVTQWIDKNIYSLIPPGFLYTRPIGDEGATIGLNTTYIIR